MTYTRHPIPVVLTDRRGYRYIFTDPGTGPTQGGPTPGVMTDVNGRELSSAMALDDFIASPVSLVLTDENGYALVTGHSAGEFTRAPMAAVVTDKDGNVVPLGAAAGVFVGAPISIVLTDADGNAIVGANPIDSGNRLLMENGVDNFLLEDSSGVLLLE